MKPEFQYFSVTDERHANQCGMPDLPKNVLMYAAGSYNPWEMVEHRMIPELSKPPHRFPRYEKEFFACAAGLADSHNIRPKLLESLRDHSDFLVTDKTDFSHYCSIVARSRFSLCPRGSGPTSFRFYESLMCGTIPVNISDIFVYPYTDEVNYADISVNVSADSMYNLSQILHAISPERIKELEKNGRRYVREYLQWNRVYDRLIQDVRKDTID